MYTDQAKEEYYIELSDGGKWYPHKDGQDIHAEVVGHSLSQLCRFTGHSRKFYSVAEHSVKCSYLVDPDFAYEALLHDAHEAIVNDLSKPVKAYIGGSYQELEDKVERDVRRSFGLSDEISANVKKADILMVIIEGADLLKSRGANWHYYDDYRMEAMSRAKSFKYLYPHCWSPGRAYDEFMHRFWELQKEYVSSGRGNV